MLLFGNGLDNKTTPFQFSSPATLVWILLPKMSIHLLLKIDMYTWIEFVYSVGFDNEMTMHFTLFCELRLNILFQEQMSQDRYNIAKCSTASKQQFHMSKLIGDASVMHAQANYERYTNTTQSLCVLCMSGSMSAYSSGFRPTIFLPIECKAPFRQNRPLRF